MVDVSWQVDPQKLYPANIEPHEYVTVTAAGCREPPDDGAAAIKAVEHAESVAHAVPLTERVIVRLAGVRVSTAALIALTVSV
jgi:hypothetical protein